MRVFILALGTRGDVELFVTLGRELNAHGHELTVGVCAFEQPLVETAGLRSVSVAEGSQGELTSVLEGLSSIPDKIDRTREYVRRWLLPKLKEARARTAALAGEADYFISNLQLQLEKNGRPVPGAAIIYDPPIEAPGSPKFVADTRNGSVVFLAALHRDLVDPQGTWPADVQFTGFWRSWRSNDLHVPSMLKEFVEAGSPPIVLTMGSMTMFDSARLTAIFHQSLQATGQRGVVVRGWSNGNDTAVSSDKMIIVDDAPYHWLFARSAAVIHHGGCGTLAEVLSSGAPSILMPQIAAQAKFGEMLTRQYLAAGVLDAQRTQPAELAAAIRRAVEDREIIASARSWQSKVADDAGVAGAAAIIEAHAKSASE